MTPTERDQSDNRAARTPGEAVPPAARRVLERAPGDRYRQTTEREPQPDERPMSGSSVRALAVAVVPAALGTAVLIVLASPLALSEPLVLVALAVGVCVGLLTRWGGGSNVPVTRRRAIAVGIAAIAVGAAQVIVWQLALAEGGVLPLFDYLLQTFGPVAPLQLVAAAAAAWATA
jgi:hypothetical protein